MDERTKTKDEDDPRDHIISAGHNCRRRAGDTAGGAYTVAADFVLVTHKTP